MRDVSGGKEGKSLDATSSIRHSPSYPSQCQPSHGVLAGTKTLGRLQFLATFQNTRLASSFLGRGNIGELQTVDTDIEFGELYIRRYWF